MRKKTFQLTKKGRRKGSVGSLKNVAELPWDERREALRVGNAEWRMGKFLAAIAEKEKLESELKAAGERLAQLGGWVENMGSSLADAKKVFLRVRSGKRKRMVIEALAAVSDRLVALDRIQRSVKIQSIIRAKKLSQAALEIENVHREILRDPKSAGLQLVKIRKDSSNPVGCRAGGLMDAFTKQVLAPLGLAENKAARRVDRALSARDPKMLEYASAAISAAERIEEIKRKPELAADLVANISPGKWAKIAGISPADFADAARLAGLGFLVRKRGRPATTDK